MRHLKIYLLIIIALSCVVIPGITENQTPISLLEMVNNRHSPQIKDFILYDQTVYHFDEVDVCILERCADPRDMYFCFKCTLNLEDYELRAMDEIEGKEGSALFSDHPICYVNITPESPFYPFHCEEAYDYCIMDHTYYKITGGCPYENFWEVLDCPENSYPASIQIHFIVDLLLVNGESIYSKQESFEKEIEFQPIVDKCKLTGPLSYPEYGLEIQKFDLFLTTFAVHQNLDYEFLPTDLSENHHYGLLILNDKNQPLTYEPILPERLKLCVYDQNTQRVLYLEEWKREGKQYIPIIQ